MAGLKVMVYDATDTVPDQLELADSWKLGGVLYKLVKQVDHIIAATSWAQAVKELNAIKQPIEEIQFWGHGCPGKFFIAGKPLDDLVLEAITFKVKNLVWFRSCGTFAGSRGHNFAKKIARKFQCQVAGHTFIIGPLQSGLHSLKPGKEPSWSIEEGLDGKGKMKNSSPWAPNTITCLHADVPKGW